MAPDAAGPSPRELRSGSLPRTGRGAWYGLAIDVIRPMLVHGGRMRFRGLRHVPRTGGVIIASNHLSFADPATLTFFCLAAGRVPRYLARDDLWRMPVIGRVMTSGGHIPVHRGRSSVVDAFRDAVGAVEAGECVVVFPESTFSDDPDGWPARGKPGVARMALATGAPVVPVANWGTHHLLPRGSYLPRFLRRPAVDIVAGPPVALDDLTPPGGGRVGAAALAEATGRIMGSLTGLLADIRGEVPPVTR
nr:lysophospholipid acyltransferase family protein [Amycolatopsis suaedae]